jgi:hypothetical protein
MNKEVAACISKLASIQFKFGDFLQAEGYGGIKDRIENLCEEFEEELDNRINGDTAFKELHG